jgi:general secretion pathway protein F
MGGALPWSTRVVLGLSEFAQSYGVLALILLALAVLAAKRALTGPVWERRLDNFRMRLPLVGALVVKVEVARFSRSLGTLLQGGVPMIRSLETASSSMNSPGLRQAVEKAADGVSQGRRLVDPLIESGRFPRLALQMIKVGEETGNLGAMLMKVANVYDEEVAVSTQRMLALLEPLLIVVLGVMVAMIVLSVLLGITSVTDVPL